MKYKKYSLVVLSIFLILFVFIASASAGDTNDADIVSIDESTDIYNEKLALDSSSDTGSVSNGSNVLGNNGDNLLSEDDGGIEFISQAENEEIISEENDGTFSELQGNITEKYGSTLTLTKDYKCEDGFDSKGILINQSITIDGQGHKIDAQGKSRIFKITADNVILKNINFINANTTGQGGAVYFEKSGTVSDCNFTNNKATYVAAFGGAIYMESGSVNNCNFVNNSATGDGGAVYFYTGGNVTDCNFTNNKASGKGGAVYIDAAFSNFKINSTFINNSAYQGGAIFFNNETDGIIIDGYFEGNYAERIGGAICFQDASYNNVISAEFYNNSAIYASGGAIFFRNIAENNTFNGIFMGNFAVNGGGIFFYNKANNNRFVADFVFNVANSSGGAIVFFAVSDNNNFTGCFINNSALGGGLNINVSGNGGAITFGNVSSNCVFLGDFINNTAAMYGGAVNFRNTPHNITFEGDFIDNNATFGGGINFFENFENVVFNGEFIGNSAVNGGAIALGVSIIKDVLFKNNYAELGGAIYFAESAGEVINCIFDNNSANYGGAVYLNNESNVLNCNFINNYASSDGGAVYFSSSGTVENCKFNNNSARYGGAVYFISNGEVTDCNFTDNTANRSGGAIWMSSGTVTICNFTDNTATRDGGAIWMSSGTVTICNFDNNTATRNGGAVFFKENGTVENCNFTANTAIDDGGAVCYDENSTGKVISCNFTKNKLISDDSSGGAICFYSNATVSDCNFVNNSGDCGGAVNMDSGCVTNCNFVNNNASSYGGAVYFNMNSSDITNCNFTNNTATYCGGAIYCDGQVTVLNCNFNRNEANGGSALYLWQTETSKINIISHSTFLNNKANVKYESFESTMNGTNLEIAFIGNNNLFNAIYSRFDKLNVTNVTYWGANEIENTGNSTIVPVLTDKEAGQKISVVGVVNGTAINTTKITDADGKIVLENVTGDYRINAIHADDSYYASAEIIFTNIPLSVNVTKITTTNTTVNITAESDIIPEMMPGELYFILSNGSEIDAEYAGNGTWWALHTFDDFGSYRISASFTGSYNVSVNNGTVTVNKIQTVLSGNAITTTYNVNKYLVITLKDSKGNALSGAKVIVNLNGAKTYTTDKNGQIKVSTKGLVPKVYSAKVTFSGNTNYAGSTKNIKVTVKKATSKLTAKKKTFKKSVKIKKYSIVLKNNLGKAIKNAKVTIKVGKKTFNAKTNSKGKATFKIKKLTKKGTYKATVTYKGNAYYNKVSKKLNIKIK